jgi:hypothetical protein
MDIKSQLIERRIYSLELRPQICTEYSSLRPLLKTLRLCG